LVKEQKNKPDLYRQIALYTSIPFILAVCPVVGGFIGNKLDKWLNTSPYLMYILGLLGLLGGGLEVYNIIKRVSKE